MAFEVSIDTALRKFKKVPFIQPIIEAVSNSLEANASLVNVKFNVDRYTDRDLFGNECQLEKICSATITDNGDGFVEKNRNSFHHYMSDLKRELGCKGVGRLALLKVFGTIKINSVFRENGKGIKVEFTFDENFSKDLISPQILDYIPEQNETTVELSNVRNDYYNMAKRPKGDLREDANIIAISEKIETSLLPKLFFIKQDKKTYRIAFSLDTGKNEESILSDSTLPAITTKELKVTDEESHAHSFFLNYAFVEDKKGKRHHSYCANKRAVTPFDFKVNVPNSDSSIMLLTSDYFDERDNDERNKLDIHPAKTDSYCPVSMDMIDLELHKEASAIMASQYPDLQEKGKIDFENISTDYPYLVKYFEDTASLGAIDKDTIIKTAQKKYEKEKQSIRHKYAKLLKKHGANKNSIQEFEDFINETAGHNQQELAEYICYRQFIINILKKLIGNDEKSEKVFHDLIMKRYTDDANSFGVTENNLWLLDDRFSLYKYAASEKTIKELLNKVNPRGEPSDNIDRPDLALFYSRSPLSDEPEDISTILVELKSFTADKREKINSITQLYDYVTELNKACPRLKTFWVYAITKIDEDIAKILINQGYIKLMATNGIIIYKHSGVDYSVFISAVSTDVIVSDADARNKAFLDIVKNTKYITNATKTSETQKTYPSPAQNHIEGQQAFKQGQALGARIPDNSL